MEITVRTYSSICELIFESGNTKIVEDVATHNLKVPKSEIEKLIKAAIELSRFNKTPDVDFITDIIDDWTNDNEKEQIKDYLS